jgi:peptidoglycan/LPS O-acetylase OafA/YrhL
MHGYDPATWTAFFTAITGAAAALAGLLFVAVSINLDNILKSTTFLPARAAETLAILVFVVISSALALVPQDVELLGAEILVIAVPLTAITVRSQLKFRRQNPDSPLMWSCRGRPQAAWRLSPA